MVEYAKVLKSKLPVILLKCRTLQDKIEIMSTFENRYVVCYKTISGERGRGDSFPTYEQALQIVNYLSSQYPSTYFWVGDAWAPGLPPR
jgi:hypothetical protein